MDEHPPRSMSPRTIHTQQYLQPPRSTKQTTSPIGLGLGLVLTGAWFLCFARWSGLVGTLFWILTWSGFAFVALGLLLVGLSSPDLFTRKL